MAQPGSVPKGTCGHYLGVKIQTNELRSLHTAEPERWSILYRSYSRHGETIESAQLGEGEIDPEEKATEVSVPGRV